MTDRAPRFATTRWSMVLAAGNKREPAATAALSDLCAIYWYPLYAFLRRDGVAEGEAMDLVQGFVADLLERGEVAAAPERGRFRSYLIGALRHYRANARRTERAERRGGAVTMLSLDDAEDRYAREPVEAITPAALFERRWATALLDRALDRLQAEYVERGRGEAFEVLKDALAGTQQSTYADKAAALGVTESAIKVAVHRMRNRMRELLHDEVAQTVASAAEVETELQHLFAALAS